MIFIFTYFIEAMHYMYIYNTHMYMFAGCVYSIYIYNHITDILVAFEHVKFVWFIQLVLVHLRFCPRSKGHTLSDSRKLTPKSIVK